MSPSSLLPALIVLPLLVAFLLRPVMTVGWIRRGGATIVGQLLLLFLLLLSLWGGQGLEQQPLSITLGGFIAPLGINLYLDRLAWVLLLALQTGLLLLWPRQGKPQEQMLMLLFTAAGSGMVLAGDLFNFYVFYELMAVATFGLIGVAESRVAPLVTLRYLLLSGLGSVLALSGIALIYSHTGTLNLADLARLVTTAEVELPLSAFLLLLLGFGVKAELFAVNYWVPEVYSVVSPRFSALLAGVVSKLVVVMVVRLLLLLFPLETAAEVLLVLGMLGALSGELAAWRARSLRRMLAYSSIGQLGMIFIAFSLSLELGLLVGIALSLHHLLVKPALFLLIERPLNRYSVLLFALFSLSIVGVPPLPGFWAKYTLLTGLVEGGGPLQWLALVVFLLATVVEAGYLFRVVSDHYQGGGPEGAPLSPSRGPYEGVVMPTLLAFVLVTSAVMIESVAQGLEGVARESGDVGRLIRAVAPLSGED